jgi:hypothetical protein
MIEATDMLAYQGNCWQAHAEVLSRLGNIEQARDASREAVTRFERKGAIAPGLSWTRQ